MAMTACAAKFLHQLDLLFGERPHLLTIDGDHTNRLVILQHRYSKCSAEFTEFDRGDYSWMTVAVGPKLPDISDLYDLLRGRSAANRSIQR